jgi:uncharacterized membrane protein required for colicin V production
MNILDIIILVIIVAFAIIGFKRGVFQSLVAILGFIAVIYIAYLLKNYLGDFFVLNLPFSSYTFIPGGSMVFNVITYESIAFIVMLIVLGLVYKIALTISGIFEKLLKITIILGVPSKILGLILGAIEGYIIVYFALFFIVQPYIRINITENSKFAETILTKTPVLNKFAEDTFVIVNEIDETVKSGDTDNFDSKLTELILKRKITSADVMQKLIDTKKLSPKGIQEVIDNYKESNEETNEN